MKCLVNNSNYNIIDFLYRGYLTCAVCGCMYTATLKKSRYSYYYCTNGKGVCVQHSTYLSQARAKEMLREIFKPFVLRADLADLAFEAYAQGLRDSSKLESHSRDTLLHQRKLVDGRTGILLDLLLDSKITQEKYDEKYKELEGQKLEIELQLKNLKPTDVETTLELVRKFKSELPSMEYMFWNGDDEVRSDLLKSALWNCTVKDKEIQSTQYKLPYSHLKDLNKSDDIDVWRKAWDDVGTFLLNM